MNASVVNRRRGIRQRISLTAHKYIAILYVSIVNNLTYMTEVVFRSFFLIIFVYIFLQLWTVTYASRNLSSLGGFRISDMIWYLAATETIALSLPQLTRQIDMEVRSGEIAYLLGRPCSYVMYRFAQYIGERVVRLVMNSIVAGLIAFVFVGPPPFTWQGLVAWPLVLFFAISIEYAIYFSIGLLAFWTEETSPFALIINRLALILGGVLAPLEILPQPIRGIAQVLPFSAIYNGPAHTLIRFNLGQFGALLLQQSITLALSCAVLTVVYWLATRRVSINGG
ncbi:MAG: ABC transporter permease [Ktedonobacteraceae bacterium]